MNEKAFKARLDALPAAFGPYEVRQLLKKGGMGAVYAALDTRVDRLVALKVPCLDVGAHAGGVERFLRETRAAAGLFHPNLCPVFDVGVIDDVPYFTMPYIDGVTLAEKLAGGQCLSIGESARIARDVARAMQEAHQRGIVHRDLKPSNIMMTRQSQPVVMDFGLARCLLGGDVTPLTASGVVLGTPAYMSPEQASGLSQEAGPASDIYSLGVVLYEMFTGRTPFQAPALGQLIAQIERDAPPLPRLWRPDLPVSLETICLKALAKQPSQRFETMGEFGAALMPFIPISAPISNLVATINYPNRPMLSTENTPSTDYAIRRESYFDKRRFLFASGMVFGVAGIIGFLILNALPGSERLFAYWGILSLGVSGICLAIGFALRNPELPGQWLAVDRRRLFFGLGAVLSLFGVLLYWWFYWLADFDRNNEYRLYGLYGVFSLLVGGICTGIGFAFKKSA